MIIAAVILLFLAGYAGLMNFYYRHWQRLKEFTPSAAPSVFVSVIVAARNEKTLPSLIADQQRQQYPSSLYEVVLVNDFSINGTGLLQKTLPANFHMLQPACPPQESSKKKAIAAGVRAAKGELLLVTDADCRVEKTWVRTMAAFYQQTGASFIVAPVRYTHQRSLLQMLQALDFLTLQGITAASVGANAGTLCNGANLAYTKKAFEAVNGFEGIDKVPTGDDMLLMYKIWKQAPERVFYLKSKDVIVTTSPMPTWTSFFMQRRRWASKTLVYDDKRLLVVLALVLLLNLLPVGLLIGGFFQPAWFLYLFFFLVAKTVIEWPFVQAVAKFYDAQKLMRWFFFLQPLHVFYTVFVGIWSQVGSYEWKGRLSRPALR